MTVQLDPARTFTGDRGGYTLDGAWIVELVDHRRVDVTRVRDDQTVAFVDHTVAGALDAISIGWVDATLAVREANDRNLRKHRFPITRAVTTTRSP